MAKKSLSRFLIARVKKKRAATDKELVLKWRALRKAGVYNTAEPAAKKRLTKARRAEINRKFSQLQGLGTYQDGVIYRPLHKQVEQKTIYRIDDMGRQRFVGTRKIERYVIDPDHFQVFKKKAKAIPGDALKTPAGFIAPKLPNEKLHITKDGKVESVAVKGGAKTTFSREPLSGPVEILNLIDDVTSGRLKFKKHEGLSLRSNNGHTEKKWGQSAVMELIRRLQRYAATPTTLRHARGGMGDFDDWSNNAEIALIRSR
jgi:hypothetical protein